jgi:histone deacetylase 11
MLSRFFLTIIFAVSVVTNCSPSGSLKQLPVVHRQEYNILNDCWFITKPFYSMLFSVLHSFDAKKYETVVKHLKSSVNKGYFKFHIPTQMITDKELLDVHTQEYLNSLSSKETLCNILCIPPMFILTLNVLNRFVVNPMRWATAGTVLASDLAIEHGSAVNISGGYHHAKPNKGEGFCIFGDIPLAVQNLRKKHSVKKILYVDLDAHQGNGVEEYKRQFKDKNLYILDAYNIDNYPREVSLFDQIDYNLPLIFCKEKSYSDWLKQQYEDSIRQNYSKAITVTALLDSSYNQLVEKTLDKALKEVKPEFVIYNAGTDILEGDGVGRLNVSFDDIVKRDLMMFKKAQEKNIPILMVLSGGYTKASAEIIKKSLVGIAKEIIS